MDSEYQTTVRQLYQLRLFGAKLGLENTFRLAELAGNPQDRLRFIHVAGTNGKGSVCAMLESVYRAAGLRAGLFTSPHLVSFTERIQVRGEPISESDVTRLWAQIRELLPQFAADHHPTFFEVVTVMALLYFAAQNCDLVIWETGLGGRLDATNIVTPLAAVITNIQFDHVKWLGRTLAEIAAEKAGILKPAVPVISGENSPEPRRVIESAARHCGAPLMIVRPEEALAPPLDELELPLLGAHQKFNAAVALAVIRALQPTIRVSDAAVRTGLETVRWPGRFQKISPRPGQQVVLDGAHNPAGTLALSRAWRDYFDQKPVLILGLLEDKDWPAMCDNLAPLAAGVWIAPVQTERTAPPDAIARYCQIKFAEIPIRIFSSLRAALDAASSAPLLLITGSLYFIGEAMELLGVAAARASAERGLNDWVKV